MRASGYQLCGWLKSETMRSSSIASRCGKTWIVYRIIKPCNFCYSSQCVMNVRNPIEIEFRKNNCTFLACDRKYGNSLSTSWPSFAISLKTIRSAGSTLDWNHIFISTPPENGSFVISFPAMNVTMSMTTRQWPGTFLLMYNHKIDNLVLILLDFSDTCPCMLVKFNG